MLGHKKLVYLDHASATPLDSKVAKYMHDLSIAVYANPSGITKLSVQAHAIVEDARATVAKLLFAHANEIIFTGSGTESDALAIRGVITNYKLLIKNEKTKRVIPHIVTTTIEHPAVLENCRMLEKNGEAEVTYISCDGQGIIDPKEIKAALKENTVLVSVMYANNEIGTIQPIAKIAKQIRHYRKINESTLPLLHTDACQAMNYIPLLNIEKLGVDLMSFNSSKIYGPKGVGFLYRKRGVELSPLYAGGGQEFGMRSGTQDTVSIAGAARALEETWKMKEKESERLTKIRDHGIEKLLALSSSDYEIILNGDQELRLPNNINISISGISSELLVVELDARGIAVSAKSACKSDDPDESYVIDALHNAQGIQKASIEGSIRISLGRTTTKDDIATLAGALKTILDTYKEWK
jgi:cysteine desulfurase